MRGGGGGVWGLAVGGGGGDKALKWCSPGSGRRLLASRRSRGSTTAAVLAHRFCASIGGRPWHPHVKGPTRQWSAVRRAGSSATAECPNALGAGGGGQRCAPEVGRVSRATRRGGGLICGGYEGGVCHKGWSRGYTRIWVCRAEAEARTVRRS